MGGAAHGGRTEVDRLSPRERVVQAPLDHIRGHVQARELCARAMHLSLGGDLRLVWPHVLRRELIVVHGGRVGGYPAIVDLIWRVGSRTVFDIHGVAEFRTAVNC